jgi:1-acyl-sn-glycerol-3-phosphate acyltransferase
LCFAFTASLIGSLPLTTASANTPAVLGTVLAGLLHLLVGPFLARWSTRYRALGWLVPTSTAALVVYGLYLRADWELFLAGPILGVLCGTGGAAAFRFHPDMTLRSFARRGAGYVGLYEVLAWHNGVLLIGYLVLLIGNVALYLIAISLHPAGAAFPLFRYYLLGLLLVLCVWCWLRLFRPFFELIVEPVFWVLYKMRAAGPGVKAVPSFGPVLVIANHSSWFDPCFLAKFLPRPITPMMSARYYNVWFLRPILKHVFRVIVVPDAPLRREAPELQQAIEALGRGKCVVLFPEGYLQRKPEPLLRRFAQGVWHILRACPDVPVVSCWIEGSWGSKFSYFNGPPTKNKPMDFRRPIGVGMSTPETVPAEILNDQMATRIHLMNRVSAARTHLGLVPLPVFELPAVMEHENTPAQPESSS